MLRHRDTFCVISKTRLIPYVSRLAGVFQGVTDFLWGCNETIPALRLKPYGIRLQGGFAGEPKLFHVSDGNAHAEGDKHPSEKPLLTLTLTEERLDHLAFAVQCQAEELQEGHEADNPEVVAAILCLNSILVTVTKIKSASGSAGSPRSGHADGSDAGLNGFCCCVPLRQTSQISGAASRSSREGVSASDFGLFAQNVKPEGKHPSKKLLLTLTLTEEQLDHLAFAVLCQVGELQESHEADNSEVVEAIRCLNDISRYCNEIKKGAQS